MTARPKITLFMDIRSGFTYLAFTVLKNSPVFANCDVSYVPVDLRAMWNACGIVPAWEMKNKPAWVVKSCRLWARKFGIPMDGPPEGFLENSTTALQQALCAVSVSYPDRLSEVNAALLDVFWVQRKPIFHKELFQSVFEDVLGVEAGREVVENSQTQLTADLLTANTELAMKEGGFGLPWYVAINSEGRKEGFFGFDHFGMMTDFLGLEKPTPGSIQEGGWKAMLSS